MSIWFREKKWTYTLMFLPSLDSLPSRFSSFLPRSRSLGSGARKKPLAPSPLPIFPSSVFSLSDISRFLNTNGNSSRYYNLARSLRPGFCAPKPWKWDGTNIRIRFEGSRARREHSEIKDGKLLKGLICPGAKTGKGDLALFSILSRIRIIVKS